MKLFLSTFLAIIVSISSLRAQEIPSPATFFGFHIGDDYQLANYSKTEAYFKKLAEISDRVILQNIGSTEEGRTQYLAVISSPENLKQIERYKEISQKLARADGVDEEEAKRLVEAGKPIVWIDGGLHSTETVGSQQLIALYYRLLSQHDPETMRILDKTIILLCEANPDGQELVANWYMQEKDPKKRNMNIPRLYNKYVGHDDNRDFYMMNMKETENMSRQLYIEWMPQIVYDHHQRGPLGSVVAGPPYRGPFNYVYDPLIISSVDGIGANMIGRLNAEKKPGYTRLEGSSFNTWWNGGLRTTPYFHNMIGLLTEIRGNPTPTEIPVVPKRLTPDNATPYPVLPQEWKFRQAIDYSISLNYAVLDYASRMGDKLLRNSYTMAKHAIAKGNEDSWTYNPGWTDSLDKVYKKDESLAQYQAIFRNPTLRDPRGYIIPADQTDFPTAIKFVNALIKSGVKVYRATSAFTVKGKSYPEGSYIVKTNQAFRPYVLDMFEPQHYPNDFQYPGGPPIRPYDAAGWTLAYQMGIQFDRILDGFDGPFDLIAYGQVQPMPVMDVEPSSQGYLLSSAVNNSVIVVNELLKAGIAVSRITKAMDGLPAGSFYIPQKGYEILKKADIQSGIPVTPVSKKPSNTIKIAPARIALYDRYGGYSASGWVRWLLEQYHFNFSLVYPKDIDQGDLHSKYDVLLFIDNGIPPAGKKTAAHKMAWYDEVPEKFKHMLGSISTDRSIPAIKTFIEQGGTVVTVGAATRLAYHLGLPIQNALMEADGKGKRVPISRNKYYVPTSLLKVNLNSDAAVNWGMPEEATVVFNNSPVFSVNAEATNILPLARFGTGNLLESGWAWGQSYLNNGVVAFRASMGQGRFFAFSPEITFRAQAHGTFKMLFNALYLNE